MTMRFFVTACNAEIYHLLFFVLFVGYAGNKIDKAWQQISKTGVVGKGRNFAGSRYPTTQTGDLWPTFSGSTNFRSWIPRKFLVGSPQNFALLGVWPINTSSPNLVNCASRIW